MFVVNWGITLTGHWVNDVHGLSDPADHYQLTHVAKLSGHGQRKANNVVLTQWGKFHRVCGFVVVDVAMGIVGH